MTLSLLAACTPEPEPKPTKTALFASEEEAFAAAEETYQEYLNALNRVDLSDPETFEEVYEWTSGDASAAIRETLTAMRAQNLRMTGETVMAASTLLSSDIETAEVELHVCADVSNTDVLDAEGESVIPADRASVQSLRVTFAVGDTKSGLLITDTTGDGERTCSS